MFWCELLISFYWGLRQTLVPFPIQSVKAEYLPGNRKLHHTQPRAKNTPPHSALARSQFPESKGTRTTPALSGTYVLTNASPSNHPRHSVCVCPSPRWIAPSASCEQRGLPLIHGFSTTSSTAGLLAGFNLSMLWIIALLSLGSCRRRLAGPVGTF